MTTPPAPPLSPRELDEIEARAKIVLRPGETITVELLNALTEEARRNGDTNTELLVRYIEQARFDHEARLLFSRLLGKHALDFARRMRSFMYAHGPGSLGEKLYLHNIDDFESTWAGWMDEEPKSPEPTCIEREFSEDGTAMHIRCVHWTSRVVGWMLAESLLRPEGDPSPSPYFNNVTMTMTHRGRRYGITLQNAEDGKTPGEQLAELRASLAAMTTSRDAAVKEAGRLREALDDVMAALGDRLLANGPLSTEYAHSVMRKINAALAPSPADERKEPAND